MRARYQVSLISFLVAAGCQTTDEGYSPEYAVTGEITAEDVYEVNSQSSQEETLTLSEIACITEANVDFTPSQKSRLDNQEMENLLSGNTILSADAHGVFAIYYQPGGKTIGWMPKKISLGKQDWTVGRVAYRQGYYCRTFEEWGGQEEKCWEVHEGPNRLDRKSFYFVCPDGSIAGDQHVVLPGNALGMEYSGRGYKTGGTLTQSEDKTGYYVEKYFGNYTRK